MTAVEWLKDVIESFGNKHELHISWDTMDEIIEQAKAMEKDQIVDAFGVGCHHESKRLVGYQDTAEQYYNETYGGDK
jgi:hypothetical protein